ncbi:hypothetical protein SUDANB66_06540 (plasmid) [Streptomyces sp. SudanB66_2053]
MDRKREAIVLLAAVWKDLAVLRSADAFWASLGTPVCNLLDTKIETIGYRAPYKDVTTAEA